MKILHILHRSLPGTHGYAIRSKYIVECQRQLSLEPVVISSPFQSGLDQSNGNPEYINGVPYYRTNSFAWMGSREVRSSSIWKSCLRIPLMAVLAVQVLNVAKHIKPSLIHAHSPFYCGLVGSLVSKRLGIPCIYEVRGVWERSLVPGEGVKARASRRALSLFENSALRRADAVVAISERLKSDLLSRGMCRNIYVIPNGVDTAKFNTGEKSKFLVESLNLNGKVVLGYIGTLSAEYEGLDCLIRTLPAIVEERPEAVLMLVGDGTLRPALERLVQRMGLKERVIFVGRIPHNLIAEYYRLADICIFPRIKTPVTELVTPLKPLEAMAAGKAIIGSNVGGILELVHEGETGVLFQVDNLQDLAAKCVSLIDSEPTREFLGQQAKQWVQENRNWSSIVNRYMAVYESLCKTTQLP